MEPSGPGRGAAQTSLEAVRPGTVNIQVIVYGEGLPRYFVFFYGRHRAVWVPSPPLTLPLVLLGVFEALLTNLLV